MVRLAALIGPALAPPCATALCSPPFGQVSFTPPLTLGRAISVSEFISTIPLRNLAGGLVQPFAAAAAVRTGIGVGGAVSCTAGGLLVEVAEHGVTVGLGSGVVGMLVTTGSRQAAGGRGRRPAPRHGKRSGRW